MAATSPVLLVLGAGGNVGANIARLFATKGYRVAVSSRTEKKELTGGSDPPFFVSADFSEPSSVSEVFSKVKESLGTPSVVVYNAAAANFTKEPLQTTIAQFEKDQTINTTSVVAAAQEAIKGFATLPADVLKTFIYTGNFLNEGAMGGALSLGTGKAASAHLIDSCANAYKDKHWRFYYADERTASGNAVFRDLDGPAHAEMYLELAESETVRPWQVTFVKGKGAVEFPRRKQAL